MKHYRTLEVEGSLISPINVIARYIQIEITLRADGIGG